MLVKETLSLNKIKNYVGCQIIPRYYLIHTTTD